MLRHVAEVLLEREVLDGVEFQKLVDGEELPPRENITEFKEAEVKETEVKEAEDILELSQQKSFEEIKSEAADEKKQNEE
jgi:hypothetical protein